MTGCMKAIFVIAPFIVACAAEEPPSELTLESADDGKADSLNGKKLVFDTSNFHALDHTTTENEELMVRLSAGDKLALDAPVFQIDSQRLDAEIDPHPFWKIHEVSVSSSTGVRMGMVILDDTYRPGPLVCRLPNGRTLNAFNRVAIDFFNKQITLNDTTTVGLTACGIVAEDYRYFVKIMPVPLAWPALDEGRLPYTVHYEQR